MSVLRSFLAENWPWLDIRFNDMISSTIPHRSDGSCSSVCMFPFLGTNSPNLFQRAASEWIGEGKQGEEKEALLLLSSKSTSIFSWLSNQSSSLSIRPNIIVVWRALYTWPTVCGVVANAIVCKQQLCYEAHRLAFGLVIVLLNFLALFWFWPRWKWDLIVCQINNIKMRCNMIYLWWWPWWSFHTIPRLLRELLLTHKWLLVIIVLLADSNEQDQQLVPIGPKVGEVILPLFQGHASSHVSVATHATKATSVVATSGYFGAISQSVAEINARRRFICPKNVYGVIGYCDYTCHQEAVTKILPHIYASAKHYHAMNVEGQSSNKYATSSPNVLVILQDREFSMPHGCKGCVTSLCHSYPHVFVSARMLG